MDKVRIGVIGIGNIGTFHASYIFDGAVPEAEVTAVCDVNPERLKVAEERFGDKVARYSDYHELINSGKVDAVVVATPHYDHPRIGIDVLNAGLHLLCEKPVGVFTKQVGELNEVSAKHPELVFGVDYNQRTNSKYQKMREMVKDGAIGEIQRVVFSATHWLRTQAYYNSGGWRATWAGEGGGVLLNQDPHQLDLWQWICGMPSKVYAFTREGHYHDIEVEDDVTAYVEYPNGASGVFLTSTGEYPGTNRLEISGTKGKLVMNENGELVWWKSTVDSAEYIKHSEEGFGAPDVEIIKVDVEDVGEQHIGIMKDFCHAVLTGSKLLAPGNEGIYGLSISNAIMLSAWKHEPVSLPNDGEEFLAYLKKKIAASKTKDGVKQVVFDTSGSYGI